MAETGREPDPAVVAAATQLQAQTEAAVPSGAPYGRDEIGRPVVPGFTTDPIQPEPLVPEPAAAQAATAVAEPEPPAFAVDTNGIEDLLIEEDLDETPDDVTPPAVDEEEKEEQYLDDDARKLNARLRKLEKRNEWLEERQLTAGRKNWFEEAKRRFPLAAEEAYQEATSRRAVLKAAHAADGQVRKILEPHFATLRQAETEVRERAEAQGRANAAHSWGAPMVGAPEQAIEQAEAAAKEAALDRGNFRNLGDRVSALMKAGKLAI